MQMTDSIWSWAVADLVDHVSTHWRGEITLEQIHYIREAEWWAQTPEETTTSRCAYMERIAKSSMPKNAVKN